MAYIRTIGVEEELMKSGLAKESTGLNPGTVRSSRLLSGVHVNINKAPRKFKEITVIDSSIVSLLAYRTLAHSLALHIVIGQSCTRLHIGGGVVPTRTPHTRSLRMRRGCVKSLYCYC